MQIDWEWLSGQQAAEAVVRLILTTRSSLPIILNALRHEVEHVAITIRSAHLDQDGIPEVILVKRKVADVTQMSVVWNQKGIENDTYC
jgi:hypothetical protein